MIGLGFAFLAMLLICRCDRKHVGRQNVLRMKADVGIINQAGGAAGLTSQSGGTDEESGIHT